MRPSGSHKNRALRDVDKHEQESNFEEVFAFGGGMIQRLHVLVLEHALLAEIRTSYETLQVLFYLVLVFLRLPLQLFVARRQIYFHYGLPKMVEGVISRVSRCAKDPFNDLFSISNRSILSW